MMPHRNREPDPVMIGITQQKDAVRDAVALLASQIHAAAADVERIVKQEVLHANEPELERNRG